MIRTVSGEAYAPVADFPLSADSFQYQSQLAFVKLSDGGFVGVWNDSRHGNGSMRMQRFDLNGARVGPEIVLAGGGASLAPTPTGGFLLTWTVQLDYPTSFEVKGRFYDGDLNPLGAEFPVNTRTDGFQLGEGVAALAGGGYVITWGQPEDQTYDHVRAQIFDSAGNKVGGEIIVTENAPGDKHAMGLTALAGGGFVAAWSGFEVADQFGNLSPGLRAQIFDSAGNKVGAAFSLNAIVPGNQSGSELAALPSGGFVAAWMDDGDRQSGGQPNGNQGIWVQLFDSFGQKVGAAVRVGSAADRVTSTPTIAVTATGFIVAFPRLADPTSGRTELAAQRFDLDGNKVAEEFVIGSPESAVHAAPISLVLEGGVILLGWTQYPTSGTQYDDVRAQMLVPALHGTEAADSHSGGPGRDFYFGHGGIDTISGGAADDGLSGGDGDDVLEGGQGNDILDGGAGADLMTGGPGDDFYTVDEAGDAVVESAGEGTDTVETSRPDYSAPSAVENVTGNLGAGAVQTLRGNALSNVLTGGAADNVFYVGSGGHDVVRGGAGRDSLHIDWSDSVSSVQTPLTSGAHAEQPRAHYTDGTGRSVLYTLVENVFVTTGSGNDFIATPGSLGVPGGASTRLSTGAGEDTAYLNSTRDSFDGGSGIDGVYMSNVAETFEPFEWRVPANLFVSPAGTPQIANVEYFLNGVTGAGNDIVETGRLALDDVIRTWFGDDLVIVYHGRDNVMAGPGFDTLVVDWSDSAAPVQLDLNSNFFLGSPIGGSASSGPDRSLLFSDVERLVLYAGSAADSVTGSDLADHLSGGGGNDSLRGGFDDDRLEGGDGDDLLDGGAGADAMIGSIGNDVYVVDDFADSVTELPGEGVDEVRTSLATYSLFGTQVENLTAASNVAHDFRGSAGNNVIAGASGNDFLRLQDGGDDFVAGLGGNDVFLFGATFTAVDSVNGGLGTDQIAIQGDYAGAEALVLGSNVISVENLAILPGSDTRFGDPGTNFYSYEITVQDVAVAAGVQLVVDANRLRVGEDFTFNGSAESDGSFFIYGGGGTDTLTGGARNDVFIFGHQGQWGSADVLNGGAGVDQLALRGNYSIVFGAGQLNGIEQIGMVSAQDTRYGSLGSSYSYDLTMVDANVVGIQMTVDAAPLRPGETLTFNGSAEDDGSFRVFGGRGDDTIIASQNGDILAGNGGADDLTGGGGGDAFRYVLASDSTSGSADHILDFTPGADWIDLSRIDADTHAAGNQAFHWIGSNAFTGSGAASAGELRAYQDQGRWFVEGDTDGNGSADLVIEVTVLGPTPLGADHFLL